MCLFVAWVTFQGKKYFRCVVRFVVVVPWQVEDFRASCGAYRVRFTLEDPTARIHAYAHGKDGVRDIIQPFLFTFKNLAVTFRLLWCKSCYVYSWIQYCKLRAWLHVFNDGLHWIVKMWIQKEKKMKNRKPSLCFESLMPLPKIKRKLLIF